MGLLGFERGVSTLGQQMQFQNELDVVRGPGEKKMVPQRIR